MKKGTSLVELIAVIVIMGIIAAIAVPTTIGVINRQKKNAAVTSINSTYHMAKNMLATMETDAYEDCITMLEDDFGYTSYETLISTGYIDAGGETLDGDDIYFIYNTQAFAVIISATAPSTTAMPTSNSSSTKVGGISVYWDKDLDQFRAA